MNIFQSLNLSLLRSTHSDLTQQRISSNEFQQLGFRVGDWRVFPQLNRLKSVSEEIYVQPKVMEMLILLARHRGRTLDRKTIEDHLWPDLIVGSESLTNVVSKLRKALTIRNKNVNWIETIPKKGYRLTAPVKPLSGRLDSRSRTLRWVIIAWALSVFVPAIFTINYFYSNDVVVMGPKGELHSNFELQQALQGLSHELCETQYQSEDSGAYKCVVIFTEQAGSDSSNETMTADIGT